MMTHGARARVAIAALVVVLLAACGGGEEPVESPSALPSEVLTGTAAADVTATLSPADCSAGCTEYIASVDAFLVKWSDATDLAARTARISLPGPVAAMQELARDLEGLEEPTCAAGLKERLVSWCRLTVDAYLAFMSSHDSESTALLSQAREEEARAMVRLEALRSGVSVPGREYAVRYRIRTSSPQDAVPVAYLLPDGTTADSTISTPWEYEAGTFLVLDADVPTVSAVNTGQGTLKCVIEVDGDVWVEKAGSGEGARVECSTVLPGY